MVSCRRWVRSAISLLACWVLLPACLSSTHTTPGTATPTTAASPPASPQAQPTEPPKPTAGGSLIVALPAEPDTLNPTLTTMTVARWVLDTVDARLVRIRQDGSDEAELLAEVPSLDNGGISPDGQTYVLHFKPDLAWSDGEALDARDFVFTWRTVTNPSYPAVSRAGWDLITSVSLSADNLTATVRLREPSAAFFDEVIAGSADSAAGFLLPAHVFEAIPVSEIPQSPYGADKHVGSGPFKVAKWQTNEQIVVERNDQYAGEEPKLDRIVFRFVDDPRDALSYLDTGEIDLAPAMPEALIPEFSHVPESFVLATPKAGAVESFAFNLTAPGDPGEPHPILADAAVRRAIALGFDRRGLLERLFPGHDVLAAAPLDNGPWDDPSLSPIPYDPAEARRLLDQAGWRVGPDGVRERAGVRLSLTHTTVLGKEPQALLRQRIQQAFIEDMRAIGIEVVARNYSPDDLYGSEDHPGVVAERRFDILDVEGLERSGPADLVRRFSSRGTTDPGDGPANLTGYADPQVDLLLAEQAQTPQPDVRARLLTEAQEQILADLPVLPIYDHLDITVAREYVHGLKQGAVSGLWWNPEAWWVDRKSATP